MRCPPCLAAIVVPFMALLATGCAASSEMAASAAGPATPIPGYSDGARPVGAKVACVSTRQIRETIVRDDSTIDFRLINGRVLRNTLPNRCPQLGFEKTFSYAISTNQLCAVDMITVLTHAGDLRSGISCGLGDFQPVDLPRQNG